MSIIIIDPGHGGTANIGGSDANHAVGPAGTKEKDLTLIIAVKVAEKLTDGGYTVVLTRNNDSNLSLRDRATVGNDNQASVFVSIHFNGFNNPTTQGTETWVYTGASSDSILLATSLLLQLVNATGYSNRGVRSMKLGVLSPSYQYFSTAASLVEISFLTDPNEEQRLLTSAYQDSLAGAIYQAIVDYLVSASSISPDTPVANADPGGDGDA
ncbi:N-acetylmuramoyl-L-alanine amidase [Mucilaginibacter sp.]|uniref:N-acetylmuramoyl-L-alanine amidase family protein n=1 Tax=Mucilaginibacter sp. TaxID=1882438 RepID=UPI0026351D4D|nr:N-acetylmuramoyl-L-alanine amidase [Mucilaginibacter sp.]MDB4919604.1 putative N-acetylmuramoyl-L-alanine amidase [Mucilaginibacter sp.]